MASIFSDDDFKKLLTASVLQSLSEESKVQILHSFVNKVLTENNGQHIKWGVEQSVKETIHNVVWAQLELPEWKEKIDALVRAALVEYVDSGAANLRKRLVEQLGKYL